MRHAKDRIICDWYVKPGLLIWISCFEFFRVCYKWRLSLLAADYKGLGASIKECYRKKRELVSIVWGSCNIDDGLRGPFNVEPMCTADISSSTIISVRTVSKGWGFFTLMYALFNDLDVNLKGNSGLISTFKAFMAYVFPILLIF